MKTIPVNLNRALAILVAAIATTASAQNLDLPYSSGSTGEDGPFTVPAFAQAGERGSMAYDTVRQECVYFGGGSDDSNTYHGTTWTWNGTAWNLKTPATNPPARRGGVMAFDPIRNEVLLFGGKGADGGLRNDTWVWNGTTWSEKTPATSPSIREGASMVWDDARDEIFLYGGAGGANESWGWNGTTWTQKTPATSPDGNSYHNAMAYDAANSQVLLFGPGPYTSAKTWSWNGSDWSLRLQDGTPSMRYGANMVFYPQIGSIVLFGGGTNWWERQLFNSTYVWNNTTTTWSPLNSVSGSPAARMFGVAAYDSARGEIVVSHGFGAADTIVLKDNFWFSRAGATYTFDLSGNEEAIWNFTTINIPAGTTVNFKKDAANHSVLWLASENVNIGGTLQLSGAGGGLGVSGSGPTGGPGGYDGGNEAAKGKGPGGGRTQGIEEWSSVHGETAKHAVSLSSGTYGTPFAQPLIGGSGGGGGVGNYQFRGGQGGGGGGAIAISSSRDITLTGSVLAQGGGGGFAGMGGNLQPNSGGGGGGSGGTVRLVADRVFASQGTINTLGGGSYGGNGESGRIRVEGYYRQLNDAGLSGVVSKSVPVVGSILNQAGGRLLFRDIAGENVPNPPKGDEANPDVIFTATGNVEIVVLAINVPDGSPVTVKITHSSAGVIDLGPVPLLQCRATFTTTVPAGSGVMQAFTTYDVGGPETP